MLSQKLGATLFESSLLGGTRVSGNTFKLSATYIMLELYRQQHSRHPYPPLTDLCLGGVKLVQATLDILQLLKCLCSIRLSRSTLFECLLLLFRIAFPAKSSIIQGRLELRKLRSRHVGISF